MNKIDSTTDHIQSVGKVVPTGKKPSSDIKGADFQQALFQAFDLQETSSVNPSSAVSPLEEIAPTHMPVIQEPSQVVNGKTNDLLDLLDSYAAQLEDTRVSLKALTPVLEKINSSADGLLSATKTLGEENNQLRKIATHTALTARNAYIKFQRGDLLL